MLKFILPIATLGAAALLSTSAMAQPVGGIVVRGNPPAGTEIKSQAVRFDDLNVATRDGARILFHRIRAAAEEACSPQPTEIHNLPDYNDYQDFARCEYDGISLAVADVQSRALSRYVDELRYR
jgi:UrcA family protein